MGDHYPSLSPSLLRPSQQKEMFPLAGESTSRSFYAAFPSPYLAFQALTNLNLSSNELDGAAIRSCAPHMGALSCLESLDLSCNRIDTVLGLPFLPRLSRLLVAYNRLMSLDGVQVSTSREGTRRVPWLICIGYPLCFPLVGS